MGLVPHRPVPTDGAGQRPRTRNGNRTSNHNRGLRALKLRVTNPGFVTLVFDVAGPRFGVGLCWGVSCRGSAVGSDDAGEFEDPVRGQVLLGDSDTQ